MRKTFRLAAMVLAIGFVSARAEALWRWDEIDLSQTLNTSQNIELAPGVILPRNESLYLEEKHGLEGLPVSFFRLQWLNCLWPNLKTEMVMVLPDHGPSNAEVGVVLENCYLEIYVSNSDLLQPSFFH